MTSDQALNDLTELGAEVVTKYAYSDSVQVGYVISQSPDGSSPVAKGAKVTLVVSKGPSSVIIPNVKSLSKDQAITILENLGLNVKTKTLGTRKSKVVTYVSPVVGAKVKPGSTVTITLS